MEDFSVKFAAYLEATAHKIRSMTVDKVAGVADKVALGIPLIAMALLSAAFLVLTIHGALAVPLGSGGASGTLAGLFFVVGLLVWRTRKSEK